MSDRELLPTEPPAQPIVIRETIDGLSASLSDQIELLAGELRSRWRSGQRVSIETLGAAFTQVAKNEEQLLDLVYHELLIREEFGEKPTLEDFTARFPQHVERLQRLFAVHGAIEDDDWGDDLESALADDVQQDEDGGPGLADLSNSRGDLSPTEFGDNGERKKAHWPRKPRDSRPVEAPPGYELLEEIGRGGVAVVFRARQQILNRVVALKMLLAGGAASKEILARVQQEAEAVAQLQHPGIVQIHEVGEHRGLPYLSLEYIAGGTLYEWLDGRPLPPLEAARVIEQLARTTQFAHEHGVVHRDLKPANVLLSERPPNLNSSVTIPISQPRNGGDPTPTFRVQTKISDFGLARVLGSRSDLTATGQVIGTPSYMAPEQASGACDDVSPAQDIYSLGSILYELLTGRPPFRGATLFDTLEQVRTTEVVPPRHLQPRVPRDLETICLKCLEKSPDRRYPTALALAEDLRRVQDGDTITARPAGSFERSWKWVRRYPAIASLVSLALLLSVGGAIGILREAQRANKNERAARMDSQRADQLRIVATQERDAAREQRLLADEQRQIAEVQRLNAEKQALIASEERQNAERQQKLAETERARALEAQALAESSLEQSLQTINTLVGIGWSLRFEPGMQIVSKRLLDDTLRLYDGLVQKQGDSSAIRRQRIMALLGAADIHYRLRETDKSEQLLIQAARHLDIEFESSPNDFDLHYRATGLNWLLGVIYNGSGRPKEALEAFRRDMAAHDAMLKQVPDKTDRLISKANILTNMCVSLKALGQTSEAINTFDEAISILREVLRTSPNNFQGRHELSVALHDYSSSLRALGRLEPANEAFREAFDLRKQLFQESPRDQGTRTYFARLYSTQGHLDRQDRKYESSIAQFQQAVGLLSTLADDFPDVYEHSRGLLAAMVNQLNSCLNAENSTIGRPLWEQLSNRLTAAVKKFPNDKYIVNLAEEWQYQWADQLWDEGHQPKAQACAALTIAAIKLNFAASNSMTPRQEAYLCNNAAWRLAVVADPAQRESKWAVELAQRAITLSPEAPNYWHTLGTVLYFSGDYPAAHEALLKSIHFSREATARSSLDQLVLALKALSKGDTTTMRREFDLSLGLQKSSLHGLSLHYSMLAMAQWQLDDKEAARKTLQLVVDPPKGFSKGAAEYRRLIGEARTLIQQNGDSPSVP